MNPDRINEMIRYIEIFVGFGLGAGPFIGSLVYNRLEYEGTIYLFGALNLFALILCCIMLPSELNKGDKDVEESDLEGETEDDVIESIIRKNRTISWCSVLFNRHAFFALLTCFM